MTSVSNKNLSVIRLVEIPRAMSCWGLLTIDLGSFGRCCTRMKQIEAKGPVLNKSQRESRQLTNTKKERKGKETREGTALFQKGTEKLKGKFPKKKKKENNPLGPNVIFIPPLHPHSAIQPYGVLKITNIQDPPIHPLRLRQLNFRMNCPK